jgi:hypothetical protein
MPVLPLNLNDWESPEGWRRSPFEVPGAQFVGKLRAYRVDTIERCAEANTRRQGRQHQIEKIRVVQRNSPDLFFRVR